MYTNFTIGRGEELTEARLNEILNQFQTADLPVAKKLKNYYDGKQNILYNPPADETRKFFPTITNFTHIICDEFTGMLTGKPITVTGDNTEKINEIFSYNDFHQQMVEYLRQACIYGRSCICSYVDEDGQQRFQVLPDSGETCVPVYDDTIEHLLEYVIRMYVDNSDGNLATQVKYKVEVYGPHDVKYYDATSGFETFTLTHVEEHYFGQCPITILQIDEYNESVFGQILSLQDAYNEIVSDGIQNVADFSDAFLVISGAVATSSDLAEMKKNRCILLGDIGTEKVEYLTKNVSDTQMVNILENIEDKIYTVSACPDFSDEVFGNASSGLSLQFRLLAFENKCAGIESQMKKSIQRMIELCSALLNLTEAEEENLWVNAEITISRNLPVDISSIVQVVNQLRGIVSTETLLSQLPFVDDPVAEMQKLRDEESSVLDLYPEWEHEHQDGDEVDGE